MWPVRALGGLLALIGVALMFAPDLVSDPDPALDLFETIERRVRWAGLAGVGGLLIAHTRLKPWSVTLAAAAFWIVLGFLVGRLVGLALDGYDSPRQWMWVVVEVVVVALCAALYAWRRRVTSEPPS